MESHEEIPNVSIAEWILQHLRKHVGHGKIAQIFVDDDTSMTYEELLRNSVCVAEGFREMGFKSGDFASVIAGNSQQIFPIIIGFIMVDIVVAISEVEFNTDQLNQNLSQTKPRHIVTTKVKLTDVQKATAHLKPQPLCYDIDELYKEAKQKGSKADIDKFQPTKIEDLKTHSFACFFSSGTTGPQKAVVINDYGYIRSIYIGRTLQDAAVTCSVLCSQFVEKFEGPLMIRSEPFWITWWVNLLRTIRHGRTRILVGKCGYETMAEAIHKYKPDVWYGVPQALGAMLKAIEENPGKWDTSSLKLIVLTGDYCDPTTTRNFMEKLKVNIIQDYGATEMGLPVYTPLDIPPVLGSIGKPNRPFKIVDPETGEVITKPNQPGEFRVQWNAMNGYLNSPETTREAFDEEGWYKTGDIIYFNEDGYLFMVDRLKDMMKHYGYSVGPSDVESIIKKIPGVSEVAVVGRRMKDFNVGEAPAAFIVRAPNSDLTEQDVHDFFEKENVHYTRRLGGGVFFVDNIPKNPNGKVLRRVLGKRFD